MATWDNLSSQSKGHKTPLTWTNLFSSNLFCCKEFILKLNKDIQPSYPYKHTRKKDRPSWLYTGVFILCLSTELTVISSYLFISDEESLTTTRLSPSINCAGICPTKKALMRLLLTLPTCWQLLSVGQIPEMQETRVRQSGIACFWR
jgi:hypothetical protein